MEPAKIVICSSAGPHSYIEPGTSYSVLDEDGSQYFIKNNSGDTYWYPKKLFFVPVNQPAKEPEPTSAIATQVGGSHYKDMAIQPITYVMANRIPFPEGNIIKYVSRWRNKNGLEDLKKARHMMDTIIEAVEKGEYA